MHPPLWGLTAVYRHLLQDPSPTTELQLKPPWDFEGSIFTVLPGCWPKNPATMKGTNLHLFQKFCCEVVHFFCILVLPSTFIKSTAFTLPKCFTISPLIHPFAHQWQQLTMRGTSQAIGSNARFRTSPKDILTCGHKVSHYRSCH